MPSTYEGHPLDLFCPQCRVNGTAWFSPDEAACLRVDEVPEGFRLLEPPEGTIGPQFACVQCEATTSNL